MGIQEIDYIHLKRGQGCKYCGKESKRNGREKPLEDYRAKEVTESKGMEFVNITRENSCLYIYYVCPRHRDKGIQKTTLGNMRRKKAGCPYCIGRNKTTDSFKQELSKINSNIEVLGEYRSASSPIKCRCVIDDNEWYPTPNSLLNGQGCPICGYKKNADSKRKSNEEFLHHLKEINSNIIPLEDYNSIKGKIRMLCSICGYEWITTPDALINGKTGCPECAKLESHNRQAKSNEDFLKELSKVNPTLEPLEPYYNDHTKILVKCKIHNYEWYVAPNKILRKHTGCPKCVAYSNEQKILTILDGMGFKTHTQKRYADCKDKHTLPFDIYVEELNLLIEYDGEGHYMPIRRGSMSEEKAKEQLKIAKEHDKIKTEYCLNNKIPLIRIPYWENKNLESFLIQKMSELNLI